METCTSEITETAVKLRLLPKFGNSTVLQLMKYSEKGKINQILKKVDNRQFENVMDYCNKNAIKIVSYFDDEYPARLKKIKQAPALLFMKGDISLLNKPSIAIVGTRHPSDKSLRWALNASRYVAAKGYVVVSGGAVGIDTAAHMGALNYGQTICVLGCGFAKLYPTENLDMFTLIGKRNLLLSEYLPNHPPTKASLVERNRITSGLSDSVIIVATGIKGGSMWQFNHAQSQKKLIFCPNPNLDLKPNDGIRELLARKKVIPINDVSEIFPVMGSANSQKTLKLYA